MSAADLTKQAIAAKNTGNISQARDLLLRAIGSDPQYEMAWLWLSSVVNTPEEKRYCLFRVLSINPASEHAKRGITQLGPGFERAPVGVTAHDDIPPPPDLGIPSPAKPVTVIQPPQSSPEKKKSGIGAFVAAIVIVGVLGFCSLNFLAALGESARPRDPYVVVYRIEGKDAYRASLTYSNAQGGTEQTDVALPWYKTLNVPPGEHLYISAQNLSYQGDISCEIVVNGRSFRKSTSSGEFSIASCSGIP